MRVLAIIPARGGSKRIPRKNLRSLGGKPLIQWTLETARSTPGISDVIVSTDDDAIAAVSSSCGAAVPWLRPAELATDEASSADVCLHALDWFEREKGAVDGVLLLSPTVPFRRTALVQQGIDLFVNRRMPVIGVSPAKSHPMWCFEISGDLLVPMMGPDGFKKRSQDLPKAYVVNGSFYLASPSDLWQRRSFYAEGLLPIVGGEAGDSLDIDDESDWLMAELLLKAGRMTHLSGDRK